MEPDSIFHWFAHQLTRLVPRGLLLLPANASQPLSLRAQHSFWKKVWSFILSCIRLTLLFGDIGGHANVSSHLCFNHRHESNRKQSNNNICTIIFQSQPTTGINGCFFFFFSFFSWKSQIRTICWKAFLFFNFLYFYAQFPMLCFDGPVWLGWGRAVETSLNSRTVVSSNVSRFATTNATG